MKTLMRSLAVLLAAASAGTGATNVAIHSGGTVGGASGSPAQTGTNPAPAGAPAAPGAASQGTIGSPAVTGAAMPLNPNSPPPGAAVNENPTNQVQTPPSVLGAATPINPNVPVTGAPGGPPSNATLGVQVQPVPPPVAGQVPTETIANAIVNPAAASPNAAPVKEQSVQTSGVQAPATSGGQPTNPAAVPAPAPAAVPTAAPNVGETVQSVALPAPVPAVPPGAAPPIPVLNLQVARQSNGLVLTGTVNSEADKEAAGQRAAAASGGETVINDLVVQ